MSATTIELDRDAERRDPEFRDAGADKPAGAGPDWGPAGRVLFRFVFTYLLIDIFPFPIDSLLNGAYENLWNDLIPRVGRLVFGVAITVRPNGSGDTSYNYVQVFCYAALAAVATAAWTLLDRRNAAYPTLHRLLRVYVRFFLASVMITYGSMKVIKAQFPDPSLDRLLQPFGDASPMGLLWTFMGASASYNVFTGLGEMVGGLLLTTRRTTLLGALVCFGVMGHVAMLNFSYDVPVKLFSMHLVAMSLFLMAPDLGRLARLFVLNRAVEPAVYRPMTRWSWVNNGAIALRTLVVVGFTAYALNGAQWARQMYGDLSPRSSLYGIWDVEEFESDGKPRPPLATDAQRWRRVVFDFPKVLAVQLMDDSRRRYGLDLDAVAKTMALTKRDDPAFKTSFTYTEPEPGVLAMEGTLDGRRIRARMRRKEARDFLLINRDFHWINEYPFNR